MSAIGILGWLAILVVVILVGLTIFGIVWFSRGLNEDDFLER